MVQLSGHCYCSACSWAYDGPAGRNLVCHCDDCQRSNAAPFSAFVGCDPDHLILSGPIKQFESSAQSWRGFCTTCGTRLYFQSTKWPGEIHMLANTMDDPSTYKATAQVCIGEKQPWLDGLTQVQSNQSFQQPPKQIRT